MAFDRFVASRWTRGNHLFPTVIEVTDTAVVRNKRSWFTSNEMSIHLQRVASVRIVTGILWPGTRQQGATFMDAFGSRCAQRRQPRPDRRLERPRAPNESVPPCRVGARSGP
jgi:hypothetical protein